MDIKNLMDSEDFKRGVALLESLTDEQRVFFMLKALAVGARYAKSNLALMGASLHLKDSPHE